MVRLQCIDKTIEAVEYGGDRWLVEKGYIVLPMGAMDALTRPGVGFTHVLPDPYVVRRAQVVPLTPPHLPSWPIDAPLPHIPQPEPIVSRKHKR